MAYGRDRQTRGAPADLCKRCIYYKELEIPRHNGLTHIHCACVFEVFQADTFEKLYKADIVTVDPDEEACADFKDAEVA